MFNFVIYVDKEGKMPILKPIGVPVVTKSHKYWTEYQDSKPVGCKPYPGQTEVWDYKLGQYVPISSL